VTVSSLAENPTTAILLRRDSCVCREIKQFCLMSAVLQCPNSQR